MKLGRLYGFFFIVVGIIITWFGVTMYQDARFTFRIFLTGPGLAAMGFAFLFFPGGNITAHEVKTKTKDPKQMFTEAPKSHLAAWGIFFVIGVIASYLVYKIFIIH